MLKHLHFVNNSDIIHLIYLLGMVIAYCITMGSAVQLEMDSTFHFTYLN